MTFQQSMSVEWQDVELEEYVQALSARMPVLRIDAYKSSIDMLRGMLTPLRRDRHIVFVRGPTDALPSIESVLNLASYSRTGNVFDASGAIEFSA